MANVHFQIPTVPHPVQEAYRRDYQVHPEAVVYEAWTELDEHIVLFVAPDGSALALISTDPRAYASDPEPWKSRTIPCPTESEFEPGSFDPALTEHVVKAKVSLF